MNNPRRRLFLWRLHCFEPKVGKETSKYRFVLCAFHAVECVSGIRTESTGVHTLACSVTPKYMSPLYYQSGLKHLELSINPTQ